LGVLTVGGGAARRNQSKSEDIRMRVAKFPPGLLVLGLCAATVLGGCGSSTADPLLPTPTAITVGTLEIADVGTVLASSGRPLYIFSPDHHSAVTCLGACWGTWPPLLVSGSPKAENNIVLNDLATVGAQSLQVATFKGWPLYHYAGDTDAASARGQGLFLNGGPWYLMRPSGEIVTTGRSQ